MILWFFFISILYKKKTTVYTLFVSAWQRRHGDSIAKWIPVGYGDRGDRWAENSFI